RLVKMLGALKGVDVVGRDEYEIRAKRKFWCVNAIDLCASVFAKDLDLQAPRHGRRILQVSEALGNAKIAAKFAGVQKEFGAAVNMFGRRKNLGDRFDKKCLDSFSES